MSCKIYLSGGITGLSDIEQKRWRKDVIHGFKLFVNPKEVDIFDPTDYDYSDVSDDTLERERFAMQNDLRHLYDSNVVICNISSNPFSVGTNMELGIAFKLDIPIIFYNPTDVELHPWHHLMCEAAVNDIEDLVEFVKEYYIR